MSRTLFFYFARAYFIPLVLCLVGFSTIFLLADLLHYLQDFLRSGAPAGGVIAFFLLRLPNNLVNVLPMAVLLSASFTTGNLAHSHEITALRAIGVSLVQAFLPLWIAALLLTSVNLWLFEDLVPRCNRLSDRLLDQLTGGEAASKRSEHQRLVFRNADGDRDWFFGVFSRNAPQKDVLVKQFRARDRRIQWEIRAACAEWRRGTWVFYDGEFTRYDQKALPISVQSFKRREMPELSETPGEILNSLRPAEQLSAMQMLRILRYHSHLPRETRNVFAVTLWYRLAFPFSCVIAAFLGVGLAATPERGGAFIGFASALGVMILYFVVAQLAVLFGKAGFLYPVLAGLLPTLLFGAWAARILYPRR